MDSHALVCWLAVIGVADLAYQNIALAPPRTIG